MNDQAPLHPSERPSLNVVIVLSLIVGAFLMYVATDGAPTSTWFVGAWLSFGVFFLASAVKAFAWVLREHEAWRSRAGRSS